MRSMTTLNFTKENLFYALKLFTVCSLESTRQAVMAATIAAGSFSAWRISQNPEKSYFNNFTALTACLACSIMGIDKVISSIKKDPQVDQFFKEVKLAENIGYIFGL